MTISTRGILFLTALLVVGCQEAPTAPVQPAPDMALASPNGLPAQAVLNQGVAAARSATAPFHNFDKALAAGYTDRITDCFENPPVGGMGYHWANLGLFDDNVDVTRPEVLVYEPQRDGTLRLVALEYIVPFAAWTSPNPPTLFGQEFHPNAGFGIWALHLWAWRENPSGIFMDWNPKVSCAFAS